MSGYEAAYEQFCKNFVEPMKDLINKRFERIVFGVDDLMCPFDDRRVFE